MKILVTGGAGFIGSAVVRHVINKTNHEILNIDKLTYAGNLYSLSEVFDSPRYRFEKIDICDTHSVKRVFSEYLPDAIMHFAAESHVDRSIDGPADFIQTNIVGTFSLLEAAMSYYDTLSLERKNEFRFHHISTDEVYGDLEIGEPKFTECTPYGPSSPYSASKASSDHLVRAWGRTYGLPVLISNCSNNYGPYQFPEKLIPLLILNAKEGKTLPVYGDGQQIRDWLYVDDHVKALLRVLEAGQAGETYNIGGNNEMRNIDVVKSICSILDQHLQAKQLGVDKFYDLVVHVEDRPGHDRRYAIDTEKMKNELGWRPQETFETGIQKTVDWYLNNSKWCERVLDGSYRRERLGLLQRDI